MKKKLETAYGVIGLGRFGEALAMMLAKSGNEVIVVDKDEKKVKEMRQYTDCAFVTDDLSADTKIGAEVVYPERDMALRLGKKLLSNNFLDYVSLCNQVEIRQIQVPDRLIGKTIEETEIRQKYRLNIIAIEDGDETDIEVMPDYRLCHGDIIVVIGKVDNIDVFVNEI